MNGTHNVSVTMDAGEALAVVRALEQEGIRYVVSGGWGIDALVGRQTRDHADLDVGVDARRVDELIDLLAARGYAPTLDQRPARLELRASDGRVVDVHPIVWDVHGTGRQQGFGDRVYVYPGAAIVSGKIGGHLVRCISAALQREFHSGYELSERDRADLVALERPMARLQSRR